MTEVDDMKPADTNGRQKSWACAAAPVHAFIGMIGLSSRSRVFDNVRCRKSRKNKH